MNVPRTHDGARVVITTPAYRAGQAAAWRDFEKDPDSQPNRALLARLKSEEFAAGYCDEHTTFIAPVRVRQRLVEELCPECGQPDNCGDCDHTPLTDEERARLDV